ncbi:MAG: hypothetical protein P8X68_05870, partial [Desulfobacterales bacterium]
MLNQGILHPEDFDLSFKVFHELMAKKVTDILLVSSPYDAFIMEEEGRLAERIIHEYRGLNLSRPPMLTWVSSARALTMASVASTSPTNPLVSIRPIASIMFLVL